MIRPAWMFLTLSMLTACVGNSDQLSSPLLLPAGNFRADDAKGESLYLSHCQACHGTAGKGTDQGPPLVHRIYRPNHHSDMSFYKAVQRGTLSHHWRFGNMPPLPAVTPEDTSNIILYIRKLQAAAGMK